MHSTLATRALALKAKLFRGFSDASRLAILDALWAGPLSVSEIVHRTSLSQPNVSSHLGCLLDCGLVARMQHGRYAYYQLSDDRVGLLLRTADELLSEVARGVYECSRYNVPAPDAERAAAETAETGETEETVGAEARDAESAAGEEESDA